MAEKEARKGIYAELARIQKELKAPKNLHNSFANYNYRNAEGILEAVKPMLHGLALIINDEPVQIGNRYYIKATVTLTDGVESVSTSAYAREDEAKRGMDGCQITGACSSYARKYALNALLMIDDAKDSDDDSLSPKNPANAEKNKFVPASNPIGEPGAVSGKHIAGFQADGTPVYEQYVSPSEKAFGSKNNTVTSKKVPNIETAKPGATPSRKIVGVDSNGPIYEDVPKADVSTVDAVPWG